jgi:hypothetical protein
MVFYETKRVHIECRDLRAKFLFYFFWHFQNVFSAVGACPESNSPCYYIMAHMSWHANNEFMVAAFVWQFFYYLHICLLRHLIMGVCMSAMSYASCICYQPFNYSLRPISLFANTDVSTTIICLSTSVLAKSNMCRREYKFSRRLMMKEAHKLVKMSLTMKIIIKLLVITCLEIDENQQNIHGADSKDYYLWQL